MKKILGLLLLLAGVASICAKAVDPQEALITAIEDKNFDGVKKALEDGADPNKETPLVRERKVEIGGKKVSREMLPLNRAIEKDDPAIVNLLLEHKADPNIRSVPPAGADMGYTPLDRAISGDKDNSAKIVTMLLDAGANPSTQNAFGATPLNMAAFTGNKKVVELLLKRGVDPNVLTKAGTALMRAAIAGRKEIVRLLLENEATDPTIINDKGKTAANLAETDEIRDMILKRKFSKERSQTS